jgi:predicted O-methyltransferase YrrM
MVTSPSDLPEGWLSTHDIAELRRLGAGKTVLELGAYQGRSTVVLSEVAKYVVSVDRHQGVPVGHEIDSLPPYLDAIRPLRNVAIVVANFQDFVPLLDDGFDLVFIDGQHEYVEVIRDITLALLVEPAVIAFHDYDFSDVKRAATEVFGDPNNVHGSVASFRRF